MSHLWEDQSTAAIEQTLRDVKEAVLRNYQGHVSELIGFHDGDHASYMAGDSKSRGEDLTLTDLSGPNCYFQRFFPRNWDNGDGGMVPQYMPYLTRTTAIRATLFHRHPSQTLVDANGTADEEQTKRWNDLMRAARSTSRDKRLNKRVELLNTAFSYIRWDGNRIEFDVITPDNLEVYPDENFPADLDKARMIRHRLPALLDCAEPYKERWLAWERIPGETPALDEWGVYVLDNGWQIQPNPFFPDNVNPYKTFPYVVFNGEEQQDRIFQQIDDTLLTAQVGIDCLATWFHDQMPDGLSVFNTADGMPKEQPRGRNYGLNLDPQDAFSYHDMPMDAAGMKTYLEMFLKAHASLHGLTPDVFSLESEAFTQALTGLAAQTDRWDVQEVREDREPYWEYKLDLRRAKVVAVNNHHAPASKHINPDLRLQVEWAQPTAPIDPQSQAQSRKMEMDIGTGDLLKWIIEDNAEISTREAAQDRFMENLENVRLATEASGDGLRQQRRIQSGLTTSKREIVREKTYADEADAIWNEALDELPEIREAGALPDDEGGGDGV